MGDHVFLKVMPKREVIRFSKRGKLPLRYIGPFEVLEEGWHSYLLVGATTKFIECPCSVPCLHALEVHSRSNSCSELGRACC